MDFIIKGDIAHSRENRTLETVADGCLVSVGGVTQGVYRQVPPQWEGLPLLDCTGRLVIPGMADLHIHAPQFGYRGLHMDAELLEWLEKYTFPEEAKYADPDYARMAYRQFAQAMRRSATTRASVFATIHRESTLILMEELEKTGLKTLVGKVNMDRNAPDFLRESSAEVSAAETRRWIGECSRFARTKPVLTPRFIPSCTDALMGYLGEIAKETGLPVQSHLSENPGEIAWVRELMPDSPFYGEGYDRFGLFGKPAKTVMAHCVYSTQPEIDRMKENGVYIAHCPASNLNVSSGIAPIRRYLEQGLRVGLASDVAGGENESMFGHIRTAIAVSKMYWRYLDQNAPPLTFPEAFWMATRSGGSFFGKVGAFEPGFETDIIVLDDSRAAHPMPLTIAERLERSIYLGLDRDCITAKFVAGERIIG